MIEMFSRVHACVFVCAHVCGCAHLCLNMGLI